VRVDGKQYTLDAPPDLDKNRKHTVELVVRRQVMKPDIRSDLAGAVEQALPYGNGRLTVAVVDGAETPYSTAAVCPECKVSLPPLTPQLFSFNSPQGACPECSGLGTVEYFEPLLLARTRACP